MIIVCICIIIPVKQGGIGKHSKSTFKYTVDFSMNIIIFNEIKTKLFVIIYVILAKRGYFMSRNLNTKNMEETKTIESKDIKNMIEEKELNYKKLVDLMECMNCMTLYQTKVDMYLNLSSQFSNLSGYKNSDEYAKKCSQLAKETKDEITKIIYKRAQSYKDKAKHSSDYKLAADEFRKVSGYMDADDMFSLCNQLSMQTEKNVVIKNLVHCCIILLCIILIIIGYNTSHVKYYYANLCMRTGSYDSAIKSYDKLGIFKDSEERITECKYQYGLESEKEGDFKRAEILFVSLGAYKDSEERKVEIDKKVIKNSKIGNSVKVGNCYWRILDIKNNQALLLKKKALPGQAYHNDIGDVTWESSTLRQWLNSEFLNQTFQETERNNIILSNVENGDNSVYGTDGGNNTQDYIFLLSIDEVEKYNDLFSDINSNIWLRTPGYNQSCAAFLSINKSVMDYGYITTSNDITVLPALWFRID